MSRDPRETLLRRLLAYDLPIEPILEELAELPSNRDDDLVLVLVGPEHIVSIIDRHADGGLIVEQATDWADLVESRKGFGFAPPHSERVGEILSRIANPDLYGEVTARVLSELRAELARLAA